MRRSEARALAAVTAWARAARGFGAGIAIDALRQPLRLTVQAIHALDRAGLAERVADPAVVTIVLRGAPRLMVVVVPTLLVARLTQLVLGGPEELAAPRSATAVEHGVAAWLVAALLDQVGSPLGVETTEHRGPAITALVGDDDVIAVEVAVTGAALGTVLIGVPAELARAAPPARLEARWPARRAWLAAPMRWPVVLGRVSVSATAVSRLRPRAVVVVDAVPAPAGLVAPALPALLAIARGGLAAALAPGDAGLIVLGAYERGKGGAMDRTLAEDAQVEITVVAGEVALSVRDALELEVGQVVSLARPLGGTVELRVNDRLIGTGELVDVDGELGVRVRSLVPES